MAFRYILQSPDRVCHCCILARRLHRYAVTFAESRVFLSRLIMWCINKGRRCLLTVCHVLFSLFIFDRSPETILRIVLSPGAGVPCICGTPAPLSMRFPASPAGMTRLAGYDVSLGSGPGIASFDPTTAVATVRPAQTQSPSSCFTRLGLTMDGRFVLVCSTILVIVSYYPTVSGSVSSYLPSSVYPFHDRCSLLLIESVRS